jgi:hypothetical protein
MHTAILVAVVVVVALGVGIALRYERRRTEKLRDRFGPEYDRALDEMGNRRKAEEELKERERRVERLRIRPLGAADRQRFAESWCDIQAHFVDRPRTAVTNAHRLVEEPMRLRGYPLADWEQQAADLSVDYPRWSRITEKRRISQTATAAERLARRI